MNFSVSSYPQHCPQVANKFAGDTPKQYPNPQPNNYPYGPLPQDPPLNRDPLLNQQKVENFVMGQIGKKVLGPLGSLLKSSVANAPGPNDTLYKSDGSVGQQGK
jgi:hypothetical protein